MAVTSAGLLVRRILQRDPRLFERLCGEAELSKERLIACSEGRLKLKQREQVQLAAWAVAAHEDFRRPGYALAAQIQATLSYLMDGDARRHSAYVPPGAKAAAESSRYKSPPDGTVTSSRTRD